MRRFHPTFDTALGLVSALVLVMLYAPLLLVVFLSVVQLVRRRGHLSVAGIDVSSYASLAGNREILAALQTTIAVGAVTTVLSLILGLVFAFYYVKTKGVGRQIMQFLVFLPFLLPPVITGLSLLVYFRETDIPRGFATIVIGHTVLIVPVVYRTLLTRLQSLPPSLAEASYDLGASGWQTLTLVLLPQLRTALISAGLLSFALSFDETFVTLFLSGSETTLPLRLWAMMRVGFVPEVNAVAVVILALTTVLTVLMVVLQWRTRSASR